MIHEAESKERILPYPDKKRRRMENYFRISAETLQIFDYTFRAN